MPTVHVERANLSNILVNFLDIFPEPTSMEVSWVNEQE